MSNHYHMVVTPPRTDSLTALMKRCKQRYAQLRNEKRNGSGTLFESRFVSKPITSDAHLQTVTLYNDANGISAGLCATVFAHKWSTAPLHAGAPGCKIPAQMWTPSSWYLQLGTTTAQRALAYREAMTSYLLSLDKADRAAPTEGAEHPCDGDDYRQRLERPDRSSARESGILRWRDIALRFPLDD